MEENAIRVDDFDTPIYRIFPMRWFEPTLKEKRLALVKPERWEDPFENALLSAVVETPDGRVVTLDPLRQKIYAQCWGFCAESDAMWRIYSRPLDGRDDEGVKVRSTPRKLLSALYKSPRRLPEHCCFIGTVRYMSENHVISLLQTPGLVNDWVLDHTARGHAESLLFKRDSFSHEQEVRLVFDANDGYDTTQLVYKFPIEPNDLFEEAVLDPRLSEATARARTTELQALGFRNPIVQSTLYQRLSLRLKMA